MDGTRFGGRALSVVRITPVSLLDLRQKLVGVKNAATRMIVNGYTAFQLNETYRYDSEKDHRVCPICDGNDMNGSFTGNEVPVKFPINEWIDKPRTVHPRTHDNPDFPFWIKRRVGSTHGCGCKLTWSNFPDPIVEQLVKDMEVAVS